MQYRILVIDDELKDREDKYISFFNRVIEKGMVSLDVTYLRNFAEIQTGALPISEYDGILLDAILSGDRATDPKYAGADIHKVFTAIAPYKTPVLMVSRQWDSTNSDVLFHAMEYPHCLGYIRWGYVEANDDQDIMYLTNQIKMLVGATTHPNFSNLAKDSPIWILHLSDLHFMGDPSTEYVDLVAAGEMFRETFKENPHFLLITGDVAHRGLQNEFLQARMKIEDFKKHMGSPVILGVPGNHDLCLPFAAAPRIGVVEKEKGKFVLEWQDTDDSCKLHLKEYALRPYLDFANEVFYTSKGGSISEVHFDPTTNQLNHYWIERRFLSLNILIYGVNTANLVYSNAPSGCNDLDWSHRQIANHIRSIASSQANSIFTIGLYHHNPLQNSAQQVNTQPIVQCKPNLILCGHEHIDSPQSISLGNRPVVITGSGTYTQRAGSRPEDSLRGFSAIKLSRVDGQAQPHPEITSFAYSQSLGWQPNPRKYL